jgi:hypothetical protein
MSDPDKTRAEASKALALLTASYGDAEAMSAMFDAITGDSDDQLENSLGLAHGMMVIAKELIEYCTQLSGIDHATVLADLGWRLAASEGE